MRPLITILVTLAAGALVFSLLLALVYYLQSGKKTNRPPLDPGPDEAQNLNTDGSID